MWSDGDGGRKERLVGVAWGRKERLLVPGGKGKWVGLV